MITQLDMMMDYMYRGDRQTDSSLRDKPCNAARRSNGKCIREKNGNMLVEFEGRKVVILARQLRKIKQSST